MDGKTLRGSKRGEDGKPLQLLSAVTHQLRMTKQEYAYYVTSAFAGHYNAPELIEAVRGHWDSIENGSHHRRDVSMGEDASGISKRPQAHMMASLRNLTLGLFERQKHRNKDSLPSWRRKMTSNP